MKIVALEGQSFLDLAIQGGALESVFEIDSSISITDEPVIGQPYNVEVLNAPIANYYKNNEIMPATTITKENMDNLEYGGIGVMAIESTFIVR